MEKKYRLDVTTLTKKSDEQKQEELRKKNPYNEYPPNTLMDYDWTAEKAAFIELTEEEFNRVRLAILKEI